MVSVKKVIARHLEAAPMVTLKKLDDGYWSDSDWVIERIKSRDGEKFVAYSLTKRNVKRETFDSMDEAKAYVEKKSRSKVRVQ